MDCGVEKDIQKAVAEFEVLLREQVARNERIRKSRESAGNGKEEGRGVTIGLTAGDGIGPGIMKEARAVLEKLLAEELASGEVRLREIDGFTLENRLEKGQTVPDEVLTEMRQCDVLLKGPTTTPNASMNTKNLESANVYLRKTFDLYANVRPVSIPEEGIDWTFFRENTEDIYAGIEWQQGSPEAEKFLHFLQNEMKVSKIRFPQTSSFGVKPVSIEGSERLIRSAIQYAIEHKLPSVTLVHKGNIMKFTEGGFKLWGYAMAEREFGNQVFTMMQYERLKKSDGEPAAENALKKAIKEGNIADSKKFAIKHIEKAEQFMLEHCTK